MMKAQPPAVCLRCGAELREQKTVCKAMCERCERKELEKLLKQVKEQ